MKLAFSGAPEVPASRAEVWRKLMDPDFVAQSAPGVEKVERLGPTQYKVICGLGVGAIKVKFTLDVELHDLVEPERATMKARGKAPGSNVDVVAQIALSEPAPGRTVMQWSSESDVSGTVASVGGRLLEGTARKLTELFWTDFAKRVAAAAA